MFAVGAEGQPRPLCVFPHALGGELRGGEAHTDFGEGADAVQVERAEGVEDLAAVGAGGYASTARIAKSMHLRGSGSTN